MRNILSVGCFCFEDIFESFNYRNFLARDGNRRKPHVFLVPNRIVIDFTSFSS